jgi:methionyl-tRNA formyltransferase
VKAVFFGTPAWAVPALDALVRSGHGVALVVTRPDRPRGRSGHPEPPPVASAARGHGIEIVQPERVRGEEFAARLARAAPDVLVVVAYGKILPRRLLDLAPRGAINLHFSLLPAYRGAAPVQWALARGETVTGVTTMLMNERLDEGDLLLARRVEILPGEHAPALGARLAEIGAELLVETLGALDAGCEPRPQPSTGVSYAPLLEPEDGQVDPAWPARLVEGRVRGFDPWPGAWLRLGGARVRLVDVAATGRRVEGEPGTLLELTEGGLVMACGDGTALLVRRLQPAGRRVLDARDAVNGRLLAPGDRLEGWNGAGGRERNL